MEMQNTDITFDVRGSWVEEGYLPQRNSEAELNEYTRQTDEEIAALAAALEGASRRRATVKNRTCSYVHESGEECARKHLARGYCETHYKRWLRGASMEATIQERGRHTGCRYCDRKHHANGLCKIHYTRARRGGKNMDRPIQSRRRRKK